MTFRSIRKFVVSSLALLGAVATALSTLTLLPHLVHAARTRCPGGSTFGWALGTLSSTVWFAYGLGVGDFAVAAPGFFTIPAGATLAAWCWVTARRQAQVQALVEAVPMEAAVGFAGDRAKVQGGATMELPRIA